MNFVFVWHVSLSKMWTFLCMRLISPQWLSSKNKTK